MRSITMLASAVLIAGSGMCFSAEPTGDQEQPLRKLALAQADCEIATKETAAVIENQPYQRLLELTRVASSQANQRYNKALEREAAKPEEQRNKALIDLLVEERQANGAAIEEDERNLKTISGKAEKLEMQRQCLQGAFQQANQMLESLKRTDSTVESTVPLYAAIAAEARRIATEYKQVIKDLDLFQKKWEAAAAVAKAKY